MSEALTPDAPVAEVVVPEVSGQAATEVPAVPSGSAGEAATETVAADRFNGLMSSHQKALNELAMERIKTEALEARLQQETTVVPDEDVLTVVQQLRNDLQAEKLVTAKAAALAKYPAAAPLADLIVGNSAEEIEGVTAAIAQRLEAMGTVAPVTEPVVEVPVVEETAPVAPVIPGGATAPVEDGKAEKVAAALEAKDWNAYWAAKSGASADLA